MKTTHTSFFSLLNLLILLGSTICSSSYAEVTQQEQLKREAHNELEKGLKAFKSKDLNSGIVHYEKAYRLAPDHQTLFTIAHAYGRLPNSCEKALQSWERLVLRCQGCDLKAKIQEGYRGAQARCNVKLRITTPMAGATVIINEESYGETPISVLLPAKTYRIEVKQENGSSFKGNVTLSENSKSKSVSFFEDQGQLTLSSPKSNQNTLETNEPVVEEEDKPTAVSELASKPQKTILPAKNAQLTKDKQNSRSQERVKARKSDRKERRTEQTQRTEIVRNASQQKRSKSKQTKTSHSQTKPSEKTQKLDPQRTEVSDQHEMSLKSGSDSKIVVNASLQCMFKSEEGSYLPYPDCNGASLKEGDRFRVILSSPQQAFVYLFLKNDNGDRVMLFPDPGVNNKLKKEVEYVIPGEDWYELDENGGVKEQIRLIASRAPIAALEEARGLELNTKALEAISKMSFRGVRKTSKPAKMSVRLQHLDTVINSTGNEDSASISFEIDHK